MLCICSIGLNSMSVDSVAIYCTVLLYVYFLFTDHDDWLARDEWLGDAASINKHI